MAESLPVAEPATPVTFLPNLFILGAMKCGTSTLHAYLDRLPDVCMSVPKEPYFFEAEWEEGNPSYRRRYFAHWQGEPWIGEARHRNLYLPYVPARVHAFNPEAKLIAILRDPVKRAFSHWYHKRWHQAERLSFWDGLQADLRRIEEGKTYTSPAEISAHRRLFLDQGRAGDGPYRTYLDTGYYDQQLARYQQLFPASSLKVLLFEDFVREPEKTMDELVAFLGLDPQRNRFVEPIRENGSQPPEPPGWARTLWHGSGVRRILPTSLRHRLFNLGYTRMRQLAKPRMRQREQRWLSDHYRPHNRRLADRLQRDLSHWI